ncbi:MAG: T9SS type A sorting domain-containing protein [Chryseobacterium sp.]|uniref:T9SS type A sorting domain-containing protein n=1 Tax=Chryseobacterium sp. TaxID=1871047 RepID=UPI0025B9A1C7|nr:T9SS type A sorting domain-containing protein [Chryseobacterium sp.]MCJ7934495.1 T9SS type A sorting domain-containing protein [Chryseobacterium sp.]
MNKKLHLVFLSLVGLLFAKMNVQAQCVPVNVPYLEDFNASASFPPCTSWQKVNQGTWSFYTVLGGFTSRTLAGSANGSGTDLWFYTKALNLEAGKTYKLSFDYSTWLGAQSFKVAYGTSAVNTSMTNLIQNYPGVTKDNTPTSVNLTITPTVSGVYYIGFNQYTNGFSYLFFDNISVTEDVTLAVSENQLSGNGVKLYPNPASDYLYLKTDRKIANVKIHDASGKLVKSQDKPDRKIDVSQLASGTYMMVVKGADGTSSTHNFIKK